MQVLLQLECTSTLQAEAHLLPSHEGSAEAWAEN